MSHSSQRRCWRNTRADPRGTQSGVHQERRRRARERDSNAIVRNLTEFTAGSPVVHEDHGVGRYLGLETLAVGGLTTKFLTLGYAKGNKLYVPVNSLHLISRCTGASAENAPLHRFDAVDPEIVEMFENGT